MAIEYGSSPAAQGALRILTGSPGRAVILAATNRRRWS